MQHLLLLHGAIGSKTQLQPLAAHLQQDFQVHTLNFSGHGNEPFTGSPFSIQLFADNVLDYLNGQGIDAVNIFGYSMGGYVGMYLARHYPQKVTKLITLATKFDWDETIAAKQQKMFNAANILEKAPELAKQLQQVHAPNDWTMVLQQTAEMLLAMGKDCPLTAADYALVQSPALLMQGDRDKMIPLEETIAIYRSLPAARLSILPETPHALEHVHLPLLSSLIKQFIG